MASECDGAQRIYADPKLSVCIDHDTGAVAWLFLSNLADRTHGPEVCAGQLPDRNSCKRSGVRQCGYNCFTDCGWSIFVFLQPGCLGRAVCLFAGAIPNDYPRDRNGDGCIFRAYRRCSWTTSSRLDADSRYWRECDFCDFLCVYFDWSTGGCVSWNRNKAIGIGIKK